MAQILAQIFQRDATIPSICEWRQMLKEKCRHIGKLSTYSNSGQRFYQVCPPYLHILPGITKAIMIYSKLGVMSLTRVSPNTWQALMCPSHILFMKYMCKKLWHIQVLEKQKGLQSAGCSILEDSISLTQLPTEQYKLQKEIISLDNKNPQIRCHFSCHN